MATKMASVTHLVAEPNQVVVEINELDDNIDFGEKEIGRSVDSLSCRALLCRRCIAFCCFGVDRILRLPPETPARPQVAKYRRNWHRLAGLLASLVVLTLGQTVASGVAFGFCSEQLGPCSAFLERDPCLKTVVPFFVVSLIWLSVFCSCCCQSPKALSVFLLVGLCGEAVLASYMVAFDQTARIDEHLTEHLAASLKTSSCRLGVRRRPGVSHVGAGDDVESRSDAAQCFVPFRDTSSSCQGYLIGCNASRSRLDDQEKIDSCIKEVLQGISSKKQLYQTVTYSLLYMFATAHLVIALAVCVYDIRRKRAQKIISRSESGQLLNESSNRRLDEIRTMTDTSNLKMTFITKQITSDVLVNPGADKIGQSSRQSQPISDSRVKFHQLSGGV